MPPRSSRPRSLTARVRDQLLFSVVAVLILFVALRMFGVKSSVSGLFLSVLLTLVLNVGLSYLGEARERRSRAEVPGRDVDADIRWRERDR